MSCKNVIVIGNGSNLLLNENGKKIDTFDCVVRMGSFRTKGYEKYVGTKIDIYRLAWDRIIISKNESGPYLRHLVLGDIAFKDCDLLFLEPNYHDAHFEIIKDANLSFGRKIFNKPRFLDMRFNIPNKNTYVCIFHEFMLECIIKKYNIKNVHYYNLKDRLKLFLEYNKHRTTTDEFLYKNGPSMPSGGLFTIDYVAKTMPNSNIYVTGYDCFQTKYYWRKNYEFFDSHDSISEKFLYKKWLKSGRIIEL